jgi:hypothetical protein
MSGPQSGTYIIHPAQMNVQWPAHCDDIDLTPTGCIERPIDSPTDMSYNIAKLHLAGAIREVVDEACAQGLDVDEVDYSTILSFDRKFQDCLSILPWFYCNDEVSRRRAKQIDKERPSISWQRNMVHFGFNTRLSRLHRPYLAKGYDNPQFAYSRMMCLRSARMVIEMEQNMRDTAGGINPDSGRLWIITHHFFVATVTLVMDYCCHRNDPQAADRKAEIMRCYQILERSQEESAVARKGLANLKQVMREWKSKTGPEEPGLDEKDAQALESGEYPSPENKKSPVGNLSEQGQQQQRQSTRPPALMEFNPDLDFSGMDMMQDMWLDPFEFNQTNDPQWEALFRDLEQQPVGFG